MGQHLTPLEVISRFPAHDYTLASAFAGRAQVSAAKPFLLVDGKALCWGTFGAAIDCAARLLVARGIRHGDRIGIGIGA